MNKDFLNNNLMTLQNILIVAANQAGAWITTKSYEAATFGAIMAPVFDTLSESNYIEVGVRDSTGAVENCCLSHWIEGENTGTFGKIISSDTVLVKTTYIASDPLARLYFTFVGEGHASGSALVAFSIKHGFHGTYPLTE